MDRKNSYKADFQSIVSSRSFCFCVLLVALLAFGFSTFNMAVSVDDLQGYVYTGSGRNMLAAGRFTIHLIDHLTSSTVPGPISAYANDLLAILGLIWAAVNFCILFRRICGAAVSQAACTLFTCLFVSYPLIAELWEYIGAYRVVAFGFLCDSFALVLMYDVLHQRDAGSWKKALSASILMMLVCAGYESLVPVYIFCVFAVLALQAVYGNPQEKKTAVMIRQGICYAGVLLAGLVLRFAVHRIILFALNIPPETNGSASIAWGRYPFVTTIIRLLFWFYQDYILRSIVYFPLTEVLVASVILLVIGVAAAKKQGWSILLPGLGMYFSLIALWLVQGSVTGYRTCQVFAIFVAFIAMLVVMIAEKARRPWVRTAVLILCGYLCFIQADQTNFFLSLNYLRSEEEMTMVRDIGDDLYENFDMEKPVIFVGYHTLSDDIIEAASIPEDSLRWRVYRKAMSVSTGFWERFNLHLNHYDRKLIGSNVNSVIQFARVSFDGNQEGMQRLFAFAGYRYTLPDCAAIQAEADAYVNEHNVPAYPRDGFIRDVGDYIIVHIQ